MSIHDRSQIQSKTDQSAQNDSIEQMHGAGDQVLGHKFHDGERDGHALQVPNDGTDGHGSVADFSDEVVCD